MNEDLEDLSENPSDYLYAYYPDFDDEYSDLFDEAFDDWLFSMTDL